MKKEYAQYSDEELIRRYRNGQEDIEDLMDHFLEKYKNLIKSQANQYFIPGADEQDILQEGMIGLFKAVRDFDEKKDASFSTFAKLCVSRNIQTAVNKANRKKQEPLNTSVSLNAAAEDGGNSELEGQAVNSLKRLGLDDPERILIDSENYKFLMESIQNDLSTSERAVFKLMITGLGYKEIAAVLGKESKSVDNAITRIRTKARKHFRN